LSGLKNRKATSIFFKSYLMQRQFPMKPHDFAQLKISCLTIMILIASSFSLYAEDATNCIDVNKTQPIKLYSLAMNTDVSNAYRSEAMNVNEAASEGKEKKRTTVHDILGWSTLGMALVTLGSGSLLSHHNHCLLAGIATGCATATCLQGWYRYGTLKHGKWNAKLHALLGTVATIGFITTLAIVDEDGNKAHIATGAASGAVFAVSLGVFYF
jgi:hypothetical protein